MNLLYPHLQLLLSLLILLHHPHKTYTAPIPSLSLTPPPPQSLHPPSHPQPPLPPHHKRLPRLHLRHLLEKHHARLLHPHTPTIRLATSNSRHLLQELDENYYPNASSDYVHDDSTLPSVMRTKSADNSDTDDSEYEETDEEPDTEDEPDSESEQDTEDQPDPLSVSKTIRTATNSISTHQHSTSPPKSKSPTPAFKGIDGQTSNGVNKKHLTLMVFKIIKQYNIRSLIDMPCRTTLDWFPELLHQIDFEIVGFKYYCVDTDHHSQDDIRSLFGDAGNPEFLHIRPEEAHLLPKTDMVFSWDGPQQWGVKKTWSFFTALREIRPAFLMITNNPAVPNTNDQRGLLNLRKQPFHFSQALRVISNVHTGENPKQVLLYSMDKIRRGF